MSAATDIVYVVDDDSRFRSAVTRLLIASGFAVESFASAADLLAQLQMKPTPMGCVLADLDMPGMNGLELQSAIGAGPDPLPVVFLTGEGDIPTTVRAMRQGAEDFLAKVGSDDELLAAIRRALDRNAAERTQRANLRSLKARFDRLTPREHEVLGYVLQGALNKQIAAALGIDERSVKRHRTNFMAKLSVESVVHLTELVHCAGYESRKGL